ncbi:hypothetical protein C3942_11860 [Solimonas fluminis]|jgi:hypothetical protein|uniref:Uncharacterized protein n=1 Tax=Solimonas fluminis TaxID=2086571 RepID=A0A2S5TET6_9GAMM|nr:hypothetical protein [Solimonas fluminis]PPE73496.1 hypothetical protein C3942_11860 [Solimonas fluminis]
MIRSARLILALSATLLLGACLSSKEYFPPAAVPLARVVFLSLDRGSYGVEFLEDEKWKLMKRRASEHRAGAGSFFNDMSEADTHILAGQPVTFRLRYQGPAVGELPALACDPQITICAVAGAHYELQLETASGRCEVVLRKQYFSGTGSLRRETLDLAEVATCPKPQEQGAQQ